MIRIIKLTILLFILVISCGFSQSDEQEVWNHAYELWSDKDFEGCIAALNTLPVARGHVTADTYFLLALCKAETGRLEEAVKLFSMAIDKDPKLVRSYHGRGQVYIYLGRFAEAARDFKTFLKKAPDDEHASAAIVHRAFALAENGQVKEALRYLEKNHHGNPWIVYALGAYTLEYTADVDKARSHWNQALEIEPENRETLEGLAESYYETEEIDAAFYYVEKLIKYHPDHGRGHYLHGLLYQAIDQEADAAICFMRARDKGYEW